MDAGPGKVKITMQTYGSLSEKTRSGEKEEPVPSSHFTFFQTAPE